MGWIGLVLPVAIPAGMVIVGCLLCVVFGPAVERWRERRDKM